MKASKIRFPILTVYFKVIKSNLPSLIMYIGIFLVMVTLITKFSGTGSSANFEETKSTVAFFDSDHTPLTKGLKASLSQNATFVNIKDNKEALSDALFFQDAKYIVRIPKGFTEKFLSGGNATLYKTVGQNTTSGVSMDLLINRYLNTARLYNKNMQGISQQQLVKYVSNSISQKTTVTVKTFGSNAGNSATATEYFIFVCYAMISIIFLGVSTVMLVFNKRDLRSRNLSSPLSPSSIGAQLFAGHIVFMLIVWVFAIALSIVLCGTNIIGKNFALFCLNLLCVCLVCLSLSFLVGNTVKNRGAQNGICNVLSLGLSFISGIFVSQEYLSSSLLAVAHFTPTYWYVKAATDIGSLTSYTSDTLSPIINSMLIQLGFAVAIFAVAMAITRQRKRA